MADIWALHRPWCAAIATGLLQVGDGSVTAGPALERWPPDDADLLAGWLAGLRAVCAAEWSPEDEGSGCLLARALLTVLGEDDAPVAGGLWQPVFEALQVLCDRYDKRSWEPPRACRRCGAAWPSAWWRRSATTRCRPGGKWRRRGASARTPVPCWPTGTGARSRATRTGSGSRSRPPRRRWRIRARTRRSAVSGSPCPGRTWMTASRRGGALATPSPAPSPRPWPRSPRPVR